MKFSWLFWKMNYDDRFNDFEINKTSQKKRWIRTKTFQHESRNPFEFQILLHSIFSFHFFYTNCGDYTKIINFDFSRAFFILFVDVVVVASAARALYCLIIHFKTRLGASSNWRDFFSWFFHSHSHTHTQKHTKSTEKNKEKRKIVFKWWWCCGCNEIQIFLIFLNKNILEIFLQFKTRLIVKYSSTTEKITNAQRFLMNARGETVNILFKQWAVGASSLIVNLAIK